MIPGWPCAMPVIGYVPPEVDNVCVPGDARVLLALDAVCLGSFVYLFTEETWDFKTSRIRVRRVLEYIGLSVVASRVRCFPLVLGFLAHLQRSGQAE